MPCSHSNVKRMNDVRVCLNCGLTITADGKVVFDKKIVNYKPKKHKKHKRR